jgi:hypothetical protein
MENMIWKKGQFLFIYLYKKSRFNIFFTCIILFEFGRIIVIILVKVVYILELQQNYSGPT